MDQETQSAIAALEKSTDEKISALQTTVETGMKSVTEMLSQNIELQKQEKEQRDRSSEIAALCKQAGYPDYEQLIAKDNLSVEDARKEVFDWKCSQTSNLGTATGDDGVSPIEKLRNEFDAKKEDLLKAGYRDRETWVKHQCRDKDIEYSKPAA